MPPADRILKIKNNKQFFSSAYSRGNNYYNNIHTTKNSNLNSKIESLKKQKFFNKRDLKDSVSSNNFGIKNPGNHCYMISSLQMVFSSRLAIDQLLKLQLTDNTAKDILALYNSTLIVPVSDMSLLVQRFKYLENNLYHNGLTNAKFNYDNQQDAYNFIERLLTELLFYPNNFSSLYSILYQKQVFESVQAAEVGFVDAP